MRAIDSAQRRRSTLSARESRRAPRARCRSRSRTTSSRPTCRRPAARASSASFARRSTPPRSRGCARAARRSSARPTWTSSRWARRPSTPRSASGAQSVGSDARAGRLVRRFRGRGRRAHGAGRARIGNGRLRASAGGVLRRGRIEADLRTRSAAPGSSRLRRVSIRSASSRRPFAIARKCWTSSPDTIRSTRRRAREPVGDCDRRSRRGREGPALRHRARSGRAARRRSARELRRGGRRAAPRRRDRRRGEHPDDSVRDRDLLHRRECRGERESLAVRRHPLRASQRARADAERRLLRFARRGIRRRGEAADHDRHVCAVVGLLRRVLRTRPARARETAARDERGAAQRSTT